MDGTFKSIPRLFTQLFTIHSQYREHIVPLVYCLLPDKKRETYYNVLDIIKRKLAEMELVFDPDYVISDFETAQIGAVSTQLPRTHQRGCLFHFSQAVYKKVQKYHLSDLYFANPDVKSFIRQLLALPFLPATDIVPTFETLLQKDIIQQQSNLETPSNYMTRTWMDTCYPISMRYVHGQRTRTNNHLEGWHSKVNKAVGRHHPSIYTLLRYLNTTNVKNMHQGQIC